MRILVFDRYKCTYGKRSLSQKKKSVEVNASLDLVLQYEIGIINNLVEVGGGIFFWWQSNVLIKY